MIKLRVDELISSVELKGKEPSNRCVVIDGEYFIILRKINNDSLECYSIKDKESVDLFPIEVIKGTEFNENYIFTENEIMVCKQERELQVGTIKDITNKCTIVILTSLDESVKVTIEDIIKGNISIYVESLVEEKNKRHEDMILKSLRVLMDSRRKTSFGRVITLMLREMNEMSADYIDNIGWLKIFKTVMIQENIEDKVLELNIDREVFETIKNISKV